MKTRLLSQFRRLCWCWGCGKHAGPASHWRYCYGVALMALLACWCVKGAELPGADQQKQVWFVCGEGIDLVGPVASLQPSGTPDYHLRIAGVNSDKAISRITVEGKGVQWKWVSDENGKTGFWIIQYYDHADFVKNSSPSPMTNQNGVTHKGLSDIDLFFEAAVPDPKEIKGIVLECTVEYTDGTCDLWTVNVGAAGSMQGKKWNVHRGTDFLVARKDYDVPSAWKPIPILGKTFWNILNENWGKSIRVKNDTESVDITSAGFDRSALKSGSGRRLSYPQPYNLLPPSADPAVLKGIVPLLKRICFREVRVFTPEGVDVTGQAVAYGQCDGGGFDNLPRLVDGDISPDNACSANYPSLDKPQEGWVRLDFGEEKTIGRVVLHHGRRNGSAVAFVSKNFSLQSWDGKVWKDIPDATIKNNVKDCTEHVFTPVKTRMLRVYVRDEGGLYDYTTFPFSIDNPFLRKERAEEIPADRPFIWWYLDRGYQYLPGAHKPVVDMGGYGKWKEKHPNFLGFQVVEWDNDFPRHNLPWSGVAGTYNKEDCVEIDGVQIPKPYAKLSTECVMDRPLPPAPRTRLEAVQQMEAEFRYYQAINFGDVQMFVGVGIWDHYGLEWGGKMAFFENGGGGSPPIPLQCASARGAARQYGKPWGMYVANFMGNGYTDYSNPKQKQMNGIYWHGPDCGSSASRIRRQLYFGYLSGINLIDYEHLDILHFHDPDGDGRYELSPHGKAVQEVFDFSTRHPDRGVPYTPAAFLLDYTHGWRHHENMKIWCGLFPPTAGDRMIDAYLYTVYPWDSIGEREGYGAYMCTSPVGEIFDILVPNPPSGPVGQEILGRHKVLIPLGDISITRPLAGQLVEYVRGGGTLVINVKQVNECFAEEFLGVRLKDETAFGTTSKSLLNGETVDSGELNFQYRVAELITAKAVLVAPENKPLIVKNAYGRGHVILTLQEYTLGDRVSSSGIKNRSTSGEKPLDTVAYLLNLISSETLPVAVEGDVDYLVNKMDNGWLVTFINNRGVYKAGDSAAVVRPEETASVKVTLKGKALKATEWISDLDVPLQSEAEGSSFSISIPPGDLKVIFLEMSGNSSKLSLKGGLVDKP